MASAVADSPTAVVLNPPHVIIWGVLKRVQRWATRSLTDPVPKALTVAGGVLSAIGLVYGLVVDWKGFSVNVAASLLLIGPALLVSNIVVKWIQDARVKRRTMPLIRVVAQTLHWAVRSAKQAHEMLGIDISLDLPSAEADPFSDFDRVKHALADAHSKLSALESDQDRFPREVNLIAPLEFPPFGAIRRMIEQVDRWHPIPWTVIRANLAEDWSERCGIDFYYAQPSGAPIQRRYVGLGRIAELSRGTNSTTKVHRRDYLACVLVCLRDAQSLLKQLMEEIPSDFRLPQNATSRAAGPASADGDEFSSGTAGG